MTSRPNILLFTTDQQRFDSLALYGNPVVKTPNLEALAAGGAVFSRAFVQNPVCIPSRACIQTGRYTSQHGVRYMESVIDDTPGLPAWEITVMERLQCAGYRTAAFGKIHMMPEKGFHEMKLTGGKGARWTRSAGLPIGLAPLGRDYAAWLEARHPGGYERIYEERRRPEYGLYKTALPFPLPPEEYVDHWIAENTAAFVRGEHDRPFFVWCGFCGPHPPVDPPRPYDGLYPPDRVPLPPNYGLAEGGEERATTPEEDVVARRWISGYYGLVSLIDEMLGRVIAALEEKGLAENTLVIFTSDHGEMMFDFGRLGKGIFYEPVIHVPLIVAPPGRQSGVASLNGGAGRKLPGSQSGTGGAGRKLPGSQSGTGGAGRKLPGSQSGTGGAGRKLPGSQSGTGGAGRKLPGGRCACREIDGLVEVYDVAPTVLDYAGLEIPENMSARSLRPLLEGSDPGKEMALCEYVSNDQTRRGICVRTDGCKYVFWGKDREEQFFDLTEDPYERRDLADDPRYRDEIGRHRRLMIDRLMRLA